MASRKFPNLKKVFLVLIIIVFTTTIVLFGKTTKRTTPKDSRWSLVDVTSNPTPKIKEFFKIFHLDLKGSPPKLSYLFKILPVIKKAGGNAVLIEYEDMFPFSGSLKNISAGNAYSLDEVKKLIRFTETLNMEVIPLVQTFGHLEYVLKLEEFQHLREVETFPQEICPSKKEGVNLIKEMINQVMEVHKSSRFVHIGCDEVRHLGACTKCSKMNSKSVFATHVTKIANYIRNKYPKVTPLIWDDMLRRWTFNDLHNSGLSLAVQPVVWVYGNNISLLVPRFIWSIYSRIFSKIWVASAFKGAFGETETLPDLTRHFENNLSWMNFVTKKEDDVFVDPNMISGIFITGWSRYDHFAVLCELLPVGLPSLVLSLIFLQLQYQNNHLEGFSTWLNILNCPDHLLNPDLLTLKAQRLFINQLGDCSFPGSNLYSGVVRFLDLKSRLNEMDKKILNSAWVSDYNLDKNFTSPWRVLEIFPDEGFAGEKLRKDLAEWKSSFLFDMSQYFDKFTVIEWEEQNIEPIENKLTSIREKFEKLILKRVWPRRPFG